MWKIEGDNDNMLILAGPRVVGSIVRAGGLSSGWRVEVLWSGPSGDITYDAPTMLSARAFVQGVEKAWAAIRDDGA